MQALIDTMPERLPELAASLASPQCLLHGDLRVDNLFFDGDRVVVVDHQYPLLGSGLVDVAYLTSQGMDPGVRGGRNRQLVDHYLDALASAGLTVSRDDGWQQYRDAVLLNCTFPLGAIFGWAALGPRAQELLLTLIERWIVAVQELALVD